MYFSHEEGLSVSDRLFDRGVCLPSGSSLTVEEQQRVIQVVRRKLLED
jgi:pyridoxal phosphate-dependent aminotransferase EpsN